MTTPAQPAVRVSDECAACRRPLLVAETTWREARTVWGLWARANLCGDVGCESVWDADPYAIARELRRRLERAQKAEAK